MKFWDRDREIEDLKKYLLSEPNAILFVYGPKSSGKSTLVRKVAEGLDESFSFMWNDLRQRVINSVQDVLKLFFRRKGWLEGLMKTFGRVVKFNIYGIEVDAGRMEEILRGDVDAFEEMKNHIAVEVGKGRRVVIVFDEIQNLKEVYVNGGRSFVTMLFNFFVALTKVEHLAHVLVMTSDTFFIEEVYASSALKNTSEYYLVDYFDDETAIQILVDEGFSKEEAQFVVEWVGGVPWMMERVLSSGDVKGKVQKLYRDHKARLREFLGRMYDEGGKELQEKVKAVLRKMVEGKKVNVEGEDRDFVKKLVEAEVLFYDPLEGDVRFQTKLDERAAKEILALE